MFGLINRGALPPVVENEFEHLMGRLKGLWLAEHNEDGSHRVASAESAVPIGGVIAWTTNSAPTGWLLCNGSQISRLTYKPLFDIIGTTYGVGDGSTTFTLPDLRQKFVLGKANAGTGSTLGATGGEIDHDHTVSGLSISGSTGNGGAHTHTINDHTHTMQNHTHGSGTLVTLSTNESSTDTDGTGGVAVPPYVHTHGITGSTGIPSNNTTSGASDRGTDNPGDHTHGAGSLSVTGGTVDTANPPYIVLNYIIKT